MEFDFDVQACCGCNINGYGHITKDDLDTGKVKFPTYVKQVKANMSKFSHIIQK